MAFTIPPRVTTELDAVNIVLRAQGIDETTSTDSDDAEVANAKGHLNAADLEVQLRGWWFNTDYDYPLSPDSITSEIALPNGTLSVANAYWASGGLITNVTERASKLYNVDDHTFTFTESVNVDITIRLAFEDLPEVVRLYIAVLAAHRAQMLNQGNIQVARITDQQVALLLASVEQQQDKNAGSNQNEISGNMSVRGALQGFGPLRRRNSR